MASHLETTDVPLLHSPQYVTVRGRLQPLVHTYNQSYHRTQKKQGPGAWTNPTARPWTKRPPPNPPPPPLLQPKCQVDDRVRLDKKYRPFKKGYLPGWTEEVLVVTHIRRHPVVTYALIEWAGTPIKGTCKLQSTQHE
ncbi:unnamed protein product [Porites evermanni]|uniref:Uncharacterized protein n=1 Tax=Porites evermanni TaxID=104178 RepID=A0ABN8SP88_9CNID|nr:unnamed protein product [Porites evermanni]